MIATTKALRAEGLAKAFGDRIVLRDVALDLAPGALVALEGAAGSGRTTLLRCLHGTYRADGGRIMLADGTDLASAPPRAVVWARRSAIALVERRLVAPPREAVRDVVGRRLRLAGRDTAEAAAAGSDMLARVGLDGRAGEAVGSLPAVERALVGLLAVLVVPPRVVLLDAPPLEAMSSRARGGVDSLVDDVRRVGTALLVSGVMPLPGADHVLRLSEGEVVA